MDLHEDAEKNIVTASFELPGVEKQNVQIDIHNGRLTVSAETKVAEEYEEHGFAVRERRFGKFARTLQLPQGVKVRRMHGFDRFCVLRILTMWDVQDEDIKASMENGLLTVTFPKVSAETAPKKITIA